MIRQKAFEYDKLDRLTRVSGGSKLTMEYEDNGNIAYKSDAGEYTYKTRRPHAVTKVAAENMWNWIWPDIEYTGYNKPCRIHVDDLYAEDAGYLGDEAKMEFETIYSAEFDGNNDKCYCCLNLIDFFTDEGYGFEEHYYDGNYEEVTENRYDIKTYQMLSSKTRRLIYCYTPDGLTAIKVNSMQSGESALYRVETDHLGSLYALRGTDGNARYVCKYDAWGSRTLSTVPSFMRMGYCGHEHWDEFNLIDMGGRMYDPKIARFVSIDPHVQAPENIQNFNGYSYCLNNPLKYSDPSGEFFWMPFAIAGIAGVINGTVNLVTNLNEGNIQGFGEGMVSFGAGFLNGAGLSLVSMYGGGLAATSATAALGGALTSSINNIVAQTDGSWNSMRNVVWENVGKECLIGGVTGAVGGMVGIKADMCNLFGKLPYGQVGTRIVSGIVGGGVSGAATGFTLGIIESKGNIDVATEYACNGLRTGAVIGGVSSGVSLWGEYIYHGWSLKNKQVAWPSDNGFLNREYKDRVLLPGEEVSRYVHKGTNNDGGRFMAPIGVSYDKRGLPRAGMYTTEYREYYVGRPFKVFEGYSAPVFRFNSSGGGIQFYSPDFKIQELIDRHYLIPKR